jgi:acyl-CoA thioesterase-2
MPIIHFEDLLACLEIEELGPDLFTAPNVPMSYRRVFGGQLLAQCLRVASKVGAGKEVKSMHVTFPREGVLDRAIRFRATPVQDGRSFAGRWIVGEQDEVKPIVTASVSLHALEEGLFHQEESPSPTGPQDCPPCDLSMIPWETRVIDGVNLEAREPAAPIYRLWMRTPALDEDESVHQALLAHATDLTLIGTSLRALDGIGEADSPERLQTAVTSHTIWFHRRLRVDEWLLLRQTSPIVAGGRGFAHGHVFTEFGSLVASYAQESLIRLQP